MEIGQEVSEQIGQEDSEQIEWSEGAARPFCLDLTVWRGKLQCGSTQNI